MSTPTADRQFLILSFLSMWLGVRIIAMFLEVWPWSNWILIAGFALALGFVAWGYVETNVS